MPLFVTGESYGGHYVPAIAYYIHVQNQGSPKIHMPLKGIAVGDGWIDPQVQMQGYPDQMYNVGLADENQKVIIGNYCDKTIKFIKAGQMLDAFNTWDEMLNGDVFKYPNYFHNITGSNDYDNYLRTNAPESFGYYAKFMNQANIRAAVHVGSATLQSGHECELHLLEDFMVSLKSEIAVLMDNYRVVVYSGQLDVIIGAPLTEAFLPTVEWSGQADYLKAERLVWRVNPSDVEVAGFVRVVGNFTQVIIREAGHIAPYDQPVRTFDMIQRLVEGTPYENLPNPRKDDL